MAVTILTSLRPLDASQKDMLKKLFASPEFSILKELLVSQCVRSQVAAMGAYLYPDSEPARHDASDASKDAVRINGLLDLLDDIEKNDDKWFMVHVEHRQ